MIIRKALQTDLQGICNVVRQAHQDPDVSQFIRSARETTKEGEYFILRSLPHTFVAEDDGKIVGVMISSITSNPFARNLKLLSEVLWFAQSPKVSLRLLDAWEEYALDLKDAGEIDAVIMHSFAKYDLSTRKGYRPTQITYEVTR